MATVEQTQDELLQLLGEHRRFLAVSCAAFDAGDHAEAKRIATTLRVLLHQLGSGQPLLVRLGTRDQIGWLDTAGSILPLLLGAQTPLVIARTGEPPNQRTTTWQPTLDAWDRRLQERPHLPPDVEETLARLRAEHVLRSRGAWLSFAEWWDAHVLREVGGQHFTRADLVNALANIDVEAQLDPGVEEIYQRLVSQSSSGWATRLGNGAPVPLLSPALASVRQVAFEVEMSLYRGLPPTQP